MLGRALLAILFVACLVVIVVSAAYGEVPWGAVIPIQLAAAVGRMIAHRRARV